MRKAISATAMLAIIVWCTIFVAHTASAGGGGFQSSSVGQIASDESLHKMLDTMGYEPKQLKNGQLIAVKRDSWTFYMQLVLSADKSKLGFNSNLGNVENADSIPAEAWKKLLISNGDIDPSFFYLDKDAKKLYIHRVLDNRELGAAYLRQQIDNFCGQIKETADLWSFTK